MERTAERQRALQDYVRALHAGDKAAIAHTRAVVDAYHAADLAAENAAIEAREAERAATLAARTARATQRETVRTAPDRPQPWLARERTIARQCLCDTHAEYVRNPSAAGEFRRDGALVRWYRLEFEQTSHGTERRPAGRTLAPSGKPCPI